MLTQIKFRQCGHCTAVGNFAPGDIARVSAALARHLVEEARVATYSMPAAPAAPVEARPAPRKRKGKA